MTEEENQLLLEHARVIARVSDCTLKQAENFCAYLEKHRHRIINYQYYQAEQICSIGKACNRIYCQTDPPSN
jgi:hypothetical protein